MLADDNVSIHWCHLLLYTSRLCRRFSILINVRSSYPQLARVLTNLRYTRTPKSSDRTLTTLRK